MKVEQTTTGLIIHEPTDAIKRKCLQYFSLSKPTREYFIYSGNDPEKKPLFGKEKDVIYITSGFLKIKDEEISKIKTTRMEPCIPKRVNVKMNREPRSDLQRDCIEKMLTQSSNANKLTIELKPGTGKGHPCSTKIPSPTKDGYTLMGDLKVGDYVFDRHGKNTKVTGIFELGEVNVYKVTFQDGRFSYCTGEHLWNVKCAKDGSWKTLMLKDMIDIIKTDDLYIPTNKPVAYILNNLDDEIFNSLKKYTNNGKIDGFVIDRYSDGNDVDKAVRYLWSMGYTVRVDNDHIHADKIDMLKIMSIEFSHVENSRCIMVDNPEHLYLTEDFIVTHNTFIALYAISKLGYKPLIVAPTTMLKNQWIENLVDLGIDKNDIATHIHDAPNKTFCVVTISSIENEIRDDWYKLHETLNKSGFGIKVTDESHLHLKGLLKLDSICNIKHNWYLSATLGRSDQSEDRILNRALSDAERFIGNGLYEEYQKEYVNIYLQDIYYFPSTKLCEEHFRYGSKGLIRASYYNMLMNYRDGKPFLNNLITLMKRAKSIATYDGKILLLVPLISIIDRLTEEMKKDPWFSKYTFSAVNGSMPIAQRRDAMECDFILSTSMSMGTGVDVSNLAVVVNFDQYASPIITEQIVGRLRDRGKETWYIDVCDYVRQCKTISNWGRRRRVLLPYFPGVKPDIKLLPKMKT